MKIAIDEDRTVAASVEYLKALLAPKRIRRISPEPDRMVIR